MGSAAYGRGRQDVYEAETARDTTWSQLVIGGCVIQTPTLIAPSAAAHLSVTCQSLVNMQRVLLLFIVLAVALVRQSSALLLRRELEAPVLTEDTAFTTAGVTEEPTELIEPVESTVEGPLIDSTAIVSTSGTIEPHATLAPVTTSSSSSSLSTEGSTTEEDISMAATEPLRESPTPPTLNNAANAHTDGGDNGTHARHSGVNFGPVLVGAVGVVCVGVAAFFAQKRKLQS